MRRFSIPHPSSLLHPPRSESHAYRFGAQGRVTGVLNKDLEDTTGGFEKAAAKLRADAAAAGPLAFLDEVLGAECVGIRFRCAPAQRRRPHTPPRLARARTPAPPRPG